eukprot:IDg7822t1
MLGLVSIFSMLDKSIAVSIVHKGWGNVCAITCPLLIRVDPYVLCGDMMIPERWAVTVTHCWVPGWRTALLLTRISFDADFLLLSSLL